MQALLELTAVTTSTLERCLCGVRQDIYIYIHTHTHTHIYIYILRLDILKYIPICYNVSENV